MTNTPEYFPISEFNVEIEDFPGVEGAYNAVVEFIAGEIEAARAHDRAARRLHGRQAKTNFPAPEDTEDAA